MGSRTIAIAFALALGSAGGSACAMDRPTTQAAGCQVSGAELLPAETGGAAALCSAIAAARGDGAAAPASVHVRVISEHMLAATQTLADGRSLPEVKTARSDRPLGRRSFDMLAEALAAQLAAARG